MMNKIKDEFIDIISPKGLVESENLVDIFFKAIKIFEENANVYASCFSTEGDLLSQWRAYAQDGYGVSVGFSGELLEKVNKREYGIKFLPIIYAEKKQKEYAREQAIRILDLLSKGSFIYHAVGEVFENDLENLCCYKNPAFSEEKEWRLLISLSPECRINKRANYDPFVMSEIKLYSNQKRIISYLDLEYTNVKSKIIKEIILGPKCQISDIDLKRTLYILGYEISGIEVKRSEATYM